MSLGRKLTHSCCCVYNIDSLKKYQNVDCVDNDKQFILKCKKLLHTLSESSVIKRNIYDNSVICIIRSS